MKFNLKKAQAGEAVQVCRTPDTWFDMKDILFIGYDLKDHVVYQNITEDENIFGDITIHTIDVGLLRMKPKYKTWWFRTCMYNSGQPGVIVRDSEAELLDLKLPDDMYWVEDPYSKLIMDNNDEYTC